MDNPTDGNSTGFTFPSKCLERREFSDSFLYNVQLPAAARHGRAGCKHISHVLQRCKATDFGSPLTNHSRNSFLKTSNSFLTDAYSLAPIVAAKSSSPWVVIFFKSFIRNFAANKCTHT